MLQLKILNSREKKEVYSLIERQWGAKLKLDFAFLTNNKNRIFIINKDISKISLEKLRINSVGMYFCEIDNIGIRLSIEGSQIVGKEATKNVVEINDEQAKKWLKGEDMEIENNYSGFVILKYNDLFLGTGRFKEGKILNYIGKERRITAISP